MSKKIISVLLGILVLATLWWQGTLIYVMPGEQHAVQLEQYQYSASEDTMFYFWTSKRHTKFFRIGEHYQLQNGNETTTFSLFSVTYASLRPEEVKLGFHLAVPDEKYSVAASKYRVRKVPENNFSRSR